MRSGLVGQAGEFRPVELDPAELAVETEVIVYGEIDPAAFLVDD
jgi:hypothetical protein